jgi:dipeptidyl aminopeptidase/acylaminoacyl peptidase
MRHGGATRSGDAKVNKGLWRLSVPILSILFCAALQFAQTAANPEFAFVRVDRQSWIYLGLPGKKLIAGFFPALSPDRKTLAFCRAPQEGKSRLLLLDLRTRKETVLRSPGTHIRNIRWAPSGNQIAYIQFDGEAWSVHVISPDGSQGKRIYPPPSAKAGQLAGPEWMAGSKSLVCHDGAQAIEFDLEGKLLSLIPLSSITGATGAMTLADALVPSPVDGYITLYTAGSSLYGFDRQRGLRTRLSPAGISASDPAWSRDGRTIYFSGLSATDGNPQIYRVARDGAGLKQIARGEQPAP